jgi:small subunit ribosomal protein S9
MASNATTTVGRRKTATARVYLVPGSGKFTINKKDAKNYFGTQNLYEAIISPLKVTNTLGSYDITVNVDGGGFTGQVGAIQLGIARALVEINAESKPVLRTNGYMTRDPRMVERKKYGRPKARKRFQFSKR